MSEPMILRDIVFQPLDGHPGQYEANGRWGSARITTTYPGRVSVYPEVTINGFRVPPITAEILALVGIAELGEVGEDRDTVNHLTPALEYIAEVLRHCPVGLFRYLPSVHEIGGVSYTLLGGVIDRPGCIVIYQGSYYGETLDRSIEIVFSQPMPHVQSFLETKAEEDRMSIRYAVEQRIQHLQSILAAMSEVT